MDEKKRFKLIILTSCAIHFSFILFFPALGVSLKPLPEYMEVSLVKPKPQPAPKPVVKKVAPEKEPAPKPVEKKVVAVAKKTEEPASVELTPPAPKEEAVQTKKATSEPSEITPVVEKSVEPVLPEVSPVKISTQPAQKLPALPPRVSTKSEIEVPFVEESLEPSLGGGMGGSHPLAKEKGIEQEGGLISIGEKGIREREGFPEGIDLPSKATSYVKGDVKGGISYEREAGEGLGGGGEGRIKGPLGGRKILRQIEPDYPDWAQKQGVVGNVEVKCWVLSSGEVSEVRIETSSGMAKLDECALQALMKWRFEAIQEEERQWGIVPFYFSFEKE